MADNRNTYAELIGRWRKLLFGGDNRVKLLCLGISVSMWFLIKLSDEGYTAEFSFPLEYVNIPVDKRLQTEPVAKVDVRVRSHGFDLLKYRFRSWRPLKVDLRSNLSYEAGRYFWETNNKNVNSSLRFDDKIEVLSVTPDTVFFDLKAVHSKRIKVYLNAEKAYSSFKSLKGPALISPDSILVTGTEEELRNLDSIYTVPIKLKAEKDSVTLMANLDLPQGRGLEFSHKSATVKVRYTNLTEEVFDIPVEVVNLPSDYELSLFPSRVKVKFQIAVDDYNKVSPADFRAQVDFNELSLNEQVRFLSIKLSSSPKGLMALQLEPRQLEFILTQK